MDKVIDTLSGFFKGLILVEIHLFVLECFDKGFG